MKKQLGDADHFMRPGDMLQLEGFDVLAVPAHNVEKKFHTPADGWLARGENDKRNTALIGNDGVVSNYEDLLARADVSRIAKEITPDKMALVEMLREDIRSFKATHSCDRLVMVWCGSTEAFQEEKPVHASLAIFEEGLRKSDPDIYPSQMYAYAALQEGVPFANGAPNLTLDMPAILELAKLKKVPVCGKDFKT
ncbi:MAG: inositol-3-phosphate synthase, partial [Proteobacteria bacterium]|nr:inositol-3-phosphate synthase [Pseudomonadota bacterium]